MKKKPQVGALLLLEAIQKSKRNPSKSKKTLTNRETEVIIHIANGLTNREIADTLLISIKTVEKHRQNLMDKFDLRNTAAITRYAIANRFIKLEKFPPEAYIRLSTQTRK